MGDQTRARQQYELVVAMEKLLAANGVRNDVDLALFDLDRGINAPTALASARAEYAIRRSTTVAMILAWAEYKNGDATAAYTHMTEAVRLGWRDPLTLYRAGLIAQAAGDLPRAVAFLTESSRLNPEFSMLYAGDLAVRLAHLQAAAR
jgi:tetratricopeptide (TPR) repeat protein